MYVLSYANSKCTLSRYTTWSWYSIFHVNFLFFSIWENMIFKNRTDPMYSSIMAMPGPILICNKYSLFPIWGTAILLHSYDLFYSIFLYFNWLVILVFLLPFHVALWQYDPLFVNGSLNLACHCHDCYLNYLPWFCCIHRIINEVKQMGTVYDNTSKELWALTISSEVLITGYN